MKEFLKRSRAESGNTLFIIAIIGILLILFVPIPPWLLDILLLTNFALAMLILMLTLDIEKPLSFSTFPSLLLITTLLRLSLNIASTRLILQDGDAGKVIEAVGSHIVAGSYIIGFVIFAILIIVQYIVVTTGAQRVAEVAARFTLDSLPGKQMSIDADLNMGAIDQEEAKRRRRELEKESNFYGAMDGASKFVKGDAIAGVIIIFVNIIGGLAIGVLQHDMAWGDALRKYTLLTVGDGIVTQIPSLVIAVAAGIIITRAATDAKLGKELSKQLSSHPQTLLAVGCLTLLLMFLPGLPVFPLLLISALLLGAAGYAFFGRKPPSDTEQSEEIAADEEDMTADHAIFQIKVGKDVNQHLTGKTSLFKQRIQTLYRQLLNDLGLVLPKYKIFFDQRLADNEYCLSLHGATIAKGELDFEGVLAINPDGSAVQLEGRVTREPTYGLPAVWIAPSYRAQARAMGYTLVEPEIVLVTHLSEIAKRYAAEFMTRAMTEQLVESRRADLGSLIDELVPNILTYSDIQRVFQLLLQEQVSIRNIDTILEVLVDAGRRTKHTDELVEQVRQRLGVLVYDKFLDKSGHLNILTMAPSLEGHMLHTLQISEGKLVSLLPPEYLDEFLKTLTEHAERLLGQNMHPVLLCAPALRRPLRSMVWRAVPHLVILSVAEIGQYAQVTTAGMVSLKNFPKLEAHS